MRNNGLSAAQYVAVADLDPGTADLLLVALRDRGVAAYAEESPEPAPVDIGTIDRLYVDVAAVEEARALIDLELTTSGVGSADDSRSDRDLSVDFEAAFASIVASYDAPHDPATAPWPADEDLVDPRTGLVSGEQLLGPDADPEGDPGRDATGRSAPTGPTVGWEDLLRPPEPEPEPEPEDDRYVPPPPPPLPRTEPATRFAWAGVLGGPAVLFAAVLLGWHLEDWMMLVAAVAFLAGFVALVVRLGDRDDDDGDDGAVV